MAAATMKTTVVGSYPVPDWLQAHPNEPALVDAMVVAMRAQETAGIDVISDGELGRWDLQRREPGGMVERFVRFMSGVRVELTAEELAAFRQQPGMAYRKEPAAIIVGPVGAGTLNLRRDWERARALTRDPLKFTVTSPYMMAKAVFDRHYGDVRALALALADVLARQITGLDAAVVQIDEPNLPGTPADGPIAAEVINRVLEAVPGEKAVHLCFGNYGGQTIQRGDYSALIGFINALRCDHIVLETTRRPAEELASLRDVRAEIALGIGVIDVKDLQIETPEQIARRIERLAELAGGERIAYVHPDCGLRMLPRPIADAKLRALVAGRDLYLGGMS